MLPLLMDDKKTVTIVIGSDGQPQKDMSGTSKKDMKVAAANELMMAIQGGEAEKVSAALQAFYYLCEGED